jgi:hypothetical protein
MIESSDLRMTRMPLNNGSGHMPALVVEFLHQRLESPHSYLVAATRWVASPLYGRGLTTFQLRIRFVRGQHPRAINAWISIVDPVSLVSATPTVLEGHPMQSAAVQGNGLLHQKLSTFSFDEPQP